MNEETFYKIKLDLVHNTINNFVHVMQYDDGVAYIRAEIYKDWQHVYPSEEFDSAELRLKKHDGAWIKCNSVEPYIPVAKPPYAEAKAAGVYYYYSEGSYILITSSMTEQEYNEIDPGLFYKNIGIIISLEHDYIKINVVSALTDIYGGCAAVIDLYSADGHIQTAKFVLDVDRNPIQTGEAVKNVPEDISIKLAELSEGLKSTVKVVPQTLTDEEKEQARENIGAGASDLNIENGSGAGSVQQTQDGNSGVFDFTNKNPNATALDSTLTGNIPYGATGNFAVSLGGKGQASGKRAFQTGTTTIAKGNYSFSSGDNSVALADDSFAGNYKTVAAGVASFSIGYETQAIGPVSFVSGTRNKVDGGNAAGFGNDNVVSHNNQFVIGYFNNNKIGTLFEIGNGASNSNRSNSFEVYTDGHAELQTQGTTPNSVVINSELDRAIEEVKNNPDVRDIVQTKQDLDNYDTSILGNNDIIRVLIDNTHDNASTFYKYDKPNSTWNYIGQASDSYTKEQADNKFVAKDTTIDNRTRVYSATNGEPTNYILTASPEQRTIPIRYTDGRLKVGRPVDGSDSANKEYVDENSGPELEYWG